MKKFASAKRFVAKHQTAIAVVGTAITATYLHIRVIDNINDRLVEFNIDVDAFYDEGLGS